MSQALGAQDNEAGSGKLKLQRLDRVDAFYVIQDLVEQNVTRYM